MNTLPANHDEKPERRRRDRTVALACAAFAAGMVGMAYAAVPLYNWFCRATGFAGTPQVATAAPGHVLDRKVADKRTFPALDITKSGTRKEELLVDRGVLSKMLVLRRVLMPMGTNDGLEFLINKLKESKNNAEFFDAMNT